MNRRPYDNSVVGSPVLIGAVTFLVVVVSMWLSYNANNGLPFVATYDVRAHVPDAAELTRGNEVRVGGKRVGVITALEPRQGRDGRYYAELDLKLELRLSELPVDSTITVRPRSPLGLRYLELRPGRASETIPAAGLIPLRNAQAVVELDEVVNALDAPTRAALQGVVHELGTALAGRATAVNRTIEAARPLAARLRPVARNLAAPETDLATLVAGLTAATSRAIAPQADELGRLVEHAAVTAAALAQEDVALGEVLREAPPTLATAQRAARELRPVLADAAAVATALRPGTRLLPTAATRLAGAIETGTPVLRRATGLADRLGTALAALRDLAAKPAAEGAVRKLTYVVAGLEPTLRYVNPFQIRCNYLGLWTRNATSSISEGDANGTWFRFIPIGNPDEALQRSDPAPALHANPYPQTGQNGECEAGNEPYLPGQVIGNVPGDQGPTTEDTRPPEGVGR